MFKPVLIGTLSRVHLPHILSFHYPCKLKEIRHFRFMSCLYNVSSESCHGIAEYDHAVSTSASSFFYFRHKQRLNCVFLITLVHTYFNLSFVLQYQYIMQEVEIWEK